MAVPAIADWCAIDVGAGEGYVRLVIEHSDPRRVELVRSLESYRPPPEIDPIVQVMQSGKSQVVAEVSEELLASLTESVEQLKLVRQLALRSWIIAPMVARGRTLGTLTVVQGDSGRRYSREDVPLVEELARRAAMALDNARLYEAAEAANRAKDQFLATLSHELRTPLTAISGWAHMLEAGMTDETTTRLAVETIVRSARSQAELIDDLLDLSRVAAGTLHLEVKDVDLTRLAQDAVVSARPAAQARGVRLDMDAPSPVIVRGDERRLRQIVWNLLSNAVKFTGEGGEVRVSVKASTTNASLEVSDTGRGIEPEFLPHVWDRFRQADSSTSREYGGLGLGLSVVRHLAELHGGSVRAESAGRDRGARFTVELPLARTVIRPAPAVSAEGETPVLEGKHILLVEDDEASRLVIAAMLRRLGATVVATQSVEQALMTAAAQPFDAIVSDIAMPGEDGYSLVRQIRTRSTIPVIAVSAMATGPEDRQRALAAGFSDFVRKPLELRQLADALARKV
jgi:signal transduction histidine kinase